MIDFKEIPMSDELHKLLDDIQVDYAYQPIFDAKTMQIVAYEALMRPLGKSPLEFIEMYKADGNLHLLELVTVFGAFKGYKEREYDCDITINSFPEECMSDDEENMLHECFPGMSKKMIVEIVEYTDFNYDRWLTKKNQIDGRNIRVSIDDYGTGSNDSMGVIDTFSPTYIKLDRTMIMDIHLDEDKKSKVFDYINEFHSRGIKVLGEGVEKKEEMDVLIECGIDFLQGYYLGRPA